MTTGTDTTTDANTWQPPHGGWVRHDVSEVGPLGAYAARSCPVRSQWDELQPAEPAPPPSSLQALGAQGVSFEEMVVGALLERHGDEAAVLADGDAATREAATAGAMADGAALIVGGRLPVDRAGRRVGEPDLLIRAGDAPVAGRWRYRPVEVKQHGMLKGKTPVEVVGLDDCLDELAGEEDEAGRKDATAKTDLLQLAHYHRMLQACGHAAETEPRAGVIGREAELVWYRLDVPLWQTPAKSDGRKRRTRTTLEVYDFEFGFRLDIRAVARGHREDPSVELLVEPVRIAECPRCDWREHCGAILDERQDVSLLPSLGWTQWAALREVGATTIPALARLDPTDGIDGMGASALAKHVDDARAWDGPEVAYRRRGLDEVHLRRADVEVDVDMENDGEVYLWGAHVTDRSASGLVEPGYHPFADWRPDPAPAEAAALFGRFLDWLLELRARLPRAGAHVRRLLLERPCRRGALDGHLRRAARTRGRDRRAAGLRRLGRPRAGLQAAARDRPRHLDQDRRRARRVHVVRRRPGRAPVDAVVPAGHRPGAGRGRAGRAPRAGARLQPRRRPRHARRARVGGRQPAVRGAGLNERFPEPRRARPSLG
jgi:hypothetical protein